MSAIFNFDFLDSLLVHLKCYILKPHLNRTSGCRDTNNSINFLKGNEELCTSETGMHKWENEKFRHNVKHKNLSPFLAYNSKISIPTSESKEDIWSVPQCTMLLCYSGSTSHNAQCFYDDQDQFSQFSPHCRIHVHSSIILKDTVWIAEFSWFSSLFGIFKALLSLDNLNR